MNLKQVRQEREMKRSQAILFKVWNNYFKSEDGVFFSFGKGDGVHTSGCWFNCKEEEIERLREAILAGNFEIRKRIGRIGKVYKHPSEWMEKEE